MNGSLTYTLNENRSNASAKAWAVYLLKAAIRSPKTVKTTIRT